MVESSSRTLWHRPFLVLKAQDVTSWRSSLASSTTPPLVKCLNRMDCSATVAVQCGVIKTRMATCSTPYLNSNGSSFVINNCTTSNFMSDSTHNSKTSPAVINRRSSNTECDSSSCSSKVIISIC